MWLAFSFALTTIKRCLTPQRIWRNAQSTFQESFLAQVVVQSGPSAAGGLPTMTREPTAQAQRLRPGRCFWLLEDSCYPRNWASTWVR
jgi:hypothetical protein